MIYPSIDKILNKVGSKYLLVNLVSKRALEMKGEKIMKKMLVLIFYLSILLTNISVYALEDGENILFYGEGDSNYGSINYNEPYYDEYIKYTNFINIKNLKLDNNGYLFIKKNEILYLEGDNVVDSLNGLIPTFDQNGNGVTTLKIKYIDLKAKRYDELPELQGYYYYNPSSACSKSNNNDDYYEYCYPGYEIFLNNSLFRGNLADFNENINNLQYKVINEDGSYEMYSLNKDMLSGVSKEFGNIKVEFEDGYRIQDFTNDDLDYIKAIFEKGGACNQYFIEEAYITDDGYVLLEPASYHTVDCGAPLDETNDNKLYLLIGISTIIILISVIVVIKIFKEKNHN